MIVHRCICISCGRMGDSLRTDPCMCGRAAYVEKDIDDESPGISHFPRDIRTSEIGEIEKDLKFNQRMDQFYEHGTWIPKRQKENDHKRVEISKRIIKRSQASKKHKSLDTPLDPVTGRVEYLAEEIQVLGEETEKNWRHVGQIRRCPSLDDIDRGLFWTTYKSIIKPYG
jgi:hypothetical protein